MNKHRADQQVHSQNHRGTPNKPQAACARGVVWPWFWGIPNPLEITLLSTPGSDLWVSLFALGIDVPPSPREEVRAQILVCRRQQAAQLPDCTDAV